ncbi:MAG: GNAT family N-acetyltransferase [FCB group bacterium]|nr:GNAT family N-acetyltransferase [FCB group bacterium]
MTSPPVFVTDRLTVRIAQARDAALFLDLWNNPKVMSFVGFPHGLNLSSEQVIQRLTRSKKTVFDRNLVICTNLDSQSIGECKLSQPDPESIVRPDVKLLPEFWGCGFGKETWQAAVDYQFRHTDCETVEGSPNIHNHASIRMQESAGAKRMGKAVFHFPDDMPVQTVSVTHYIYQISRNDWLKNQSG